MKSVPPRGSGRVLLEEVENLFGEEAHRPPRGGTDLGA
jgi:hypothetical protein